MKNTKILVSSLLLLGATSLLASEAYSPLAYGIKSRGMGGVSIATPLGAESGLANPALLSYLPQNEVSLGLTYMQSDATASSSLSATTVSYKKEKTYSPHVVSNYKLTKKFNIGIGISRYTLRSYIDTDVASGEYWKTELQKDRIMIPLSYKVNNFSLGASIIYEKFSSNFDAPGGTLNSDYSDFGYDLGLAYKMSNTGLTFGVDYKSKIEDKKVVISVSKLGLGVNWQIANSAHSIGFDYEKIFSSEFNNEITKDQDVYAIGYSYNTDSWEARAGYRYARLIHAKRQQSFLTLPPISRIA